MIFKETKRMGCDKFITPPFLVLSSRLFDLGFNDLKPWRIALWAANPDINLMKVFVAAP